MAYYDAFKDKHKGITSWQEENIHKVLKTGKLRVPSGLVFYFPTTRVTKTGYIENTANICNYPVQNFATGDIVPLGLVFFWHRLKVSGIQSRIINTIHDSVIGEVHPDELEIYDSIGEQAMIGDVLWGLKKLFDYEFITPLEAEGEYFRNWSDTTTMVGVQ